MAQIGDAVEQKFKEALKNKDTSAISILRLAKASLVNERISKGHDLSEEEEAVVIKREVKKRMEAVESYQGAGQLERAAGEQQEADYLKVFLPAEIPDEEIRAVVEKVIAEKGKDNFGAVMGAVMKEIAGRASGDRVNAIVKEELGK